MTTVDVQGQKKNKFAAKVTKKVSTRTTCSYIVFNICKLCKPNYHDLGLCMPQLIKDGREGEC